jgi:hypothetical protein
MVNLDNKSIAIGGSGQNHSAEYGKAYEDVCLKDIRYLADNPQAEDKSKAKWIIPSTYHSRVFRDQEAHGQYWLLWFDLDVSPPILEETAKFLNELQCNYEIYTSRSASIKVQKSRIIMPLDKPLCFADWRLSQEVFNDWLEAKYIIPDRANERAAQLCYLPNKGDYYNTVNERNKGCIDPTSIFSAEIKVKNKQRIEARKATQERIEKSKAKREARQSHDVDSPIDAFNKAYEVEQILLQAGYDQKGSSFRHPSSESGSYSANVKLDETGKYRVHSLSTSDPLFSNGEGAHDAFSAFCVLDHNSNSDDALKDACDNWLTIGAESWNSVKQREYREAQIDGELSSGIYKKSPSEILRSYSATGQSEDLRKKMLEDGFVLKDLAILGQWTTFYAAPNTGKTLLTLWLIDERIKEKKINPNDVFYVNVDDTYKGGVEKIELAEVSGFHMLIPNVNGFNKNELFAIIGDLVKSDEANGKIIILDTLKKFTDIMDKKGASDFGEKVRNFISAGGTLICLAHTNKHKDADGKSIFSGTADIVDDTDCAFIIEDLGRSDGDFGEVETRVEFRNIKARGDVAEKMAFTYMKAQGGDYTSLFDSVERLSERDVAKAKQKTQIEREHKRDSDVIDSIKQYIHESELGKTELVNKVHEDTMVSKSKVQKILKRWEGKNPEKGHLWRCEKRDKNLVVYFLVKTEMAEMVDNLKSVGKKMGNGCPH